jgi:hypothetical protein
VPPGRLTAPGIALLEAFPETAANVDLLDRVLAGEPVPFDELAVPFAGPRSFRGHRYYTGAHLPILEDGRPGGVLIVANEVTEQVRRREDLAERLRHERQAAERLQRALLPEAPPVLEGLEVALRYLPAEQGLVGGDWYDVVEVGEGRVLLVIGDVCGHGLEAAAWMSQLRAAVRAYAVEDPAPAALLGRLATFSARLGLPDMVSVGAGLLDLGAGRLAWGSAGHPAPLLLAPGGGCDEPPSTVTGPPLGLGGPYAETAIEVGPGAGLVLFTDGAVEDRGEAVADGIAALRAGRCATRSPPTSPAAAWPTTTSRCSSCAARAGAARRRRAGGPGRRPARAG